MPRDLVGFPETVVDADGLVLLRAAEIMDKGGLCVLSMKEIDSHCTMGAILAANGKVFNGILLDEDHAFIQRMARRLGFDSAPGVFDWNDATGRTKEEVSARLRAAAVQS